MTSYFEDWGSWRGSWREGIWDACQWGWVPAETGRNGVDDGTQGGHVPYRVRCGVFVGQSTKDQVCKDYKGTREQALYNT